MNRAIIVKGTFTKIVGATVAILAFGLTMELILLMITSLTRHSSNKLIRFFLDKKLARWRFFEKVDGQKTCFSGSLIF